MIVAGRVMPIIEVNDALDGRRKRVTIGPGMYWCTRTFYTNDRDEWSECRTREHRSEVLGGEVGSLLASGTPLLCVRQTAEEIDGLLETVQKKRGLEVVKELENVSEFAVSVWGED
jgi:hypothetical protein